MEVLFFFFGFGNDATQFCSLEFQIISSAFQLFGQLLDTVRDEVSRLLLNVKVQSAEQVSDAAQELGQHAEQLQHVTYTAPTETGEPETVADAGLLNTAAESLPRVGRNDPCPCGSGKKYKQCHGKLN